MDQYPLRDIDDDLWRKARTRTTNDGISIKDVLVRALELYVKHGQAALPGLIDKAVAARKKTA